MLTVVSNCTLCKNMGFSEILIVRGESPNTELSEGNERGRHVPNSPCASSLLRGSWHFREKRLSDGLRHCRG